MTYITERQRFIQDLLAEGCDPEDVFFLADTQFDENGEPYPGSIYATYRKAN